MKLSHAGNKSFSQIKNVVFDWGGVITPVDYRKTTEAFGRLGFNHFENQYTQLHQSALFIEMEEGKMSAEIFREELRKIIPQSVTDTQLDDAWVAMLLDTPVENINILKKAKNNYRTFLLSNTNEIHVKYYNSYLKQKFGINGFAELFEKVYFSHEAGLRKPGREIFEFVAADSGIIPEETLFIDDTHYHIETAAALGWQTCYMKAPQTLTNLFE